MRLLVSIILLLFFQKGFSQYNFSAEFPGGMAALTAYINDDFPESIKTKGDFLMKVNVYTDNEGNVYDCEILNSYSYEVDEKIIELFLEMPQWIPAKENGKLVASITPIQFTFNPLEDPLMRGNNLVYTAVEHSPEYPGGHKAMYKYLATMEKGHWKDYKNSTFRVFVRLIVKQSGEICCVEFLKKDFASDLLLVDIKNHLSKMPNWSPGFHNGNPENVYYTFPVIINGLDY